MPLQRDPQDDYQYAPFGATVKGLQSLGWMNLKSFLITIPMAWLAGCEPPSSPPGLRLIEKGPYQALYGPDGRLQRLVYDRDGDGRAEVVTLFAPDGKPLRAEIDSDGDGVVDRWECFSAAGGLEKVGLSRDRSGRPEEWVFVDASGAVVRRERVTGPESGSCARP